MHRLNNVNNHSDFKERIDTGTQYACKLKLGWGQTEEPPSQFLGFFSTVRSLQVTADADLAVMKKQVVITLTPLYVLLTILSI